MKNKNDFIDSTLSPENAGTKGYLYIEDVCNIYETLKELVELASQQGYKLGIPTNKNKLNRHLGLYRLIKQRNDKSR